MSFTEEEADRLSFRCGERYETQSSASLLDRSEEHTSELQSLELDAGRFPLLQTSPDSENGGFEPQASRECLSFTEEEAVRLSFRCGERYETHSSASLLDRLN